MMRNPGEEKGQGDNSFRRKAGPAIALGTNLAVGVGLFTFLGYYADSKWGTGILCTMCGLVLGLAYGAYETWKVIQMLDSSGGSSDNTAQKDLKEK